MIQLDGATHVVDLAGPTLPERPDAEVLLVVERPAGERTDGCDWSPADGESNFPKGSEVFALDDGTYVVKLTQGYFVLQRE